MSLAVHNVGQLTDDEVCDRFVVRHDELEELLSHLSDDDPPRHALMIGQRGMGKSLLLRRLAIRVKGDPDLAARWLPLLMPEELYQVTSIAELWLAALDRLADTLSDADLAEQRKALLAERDPVRLETLALQRLLATARSRGQRLLLLAENVDMLLDDQISPNEGWSLRQALQTETDLLLIATAVTTFDLVEEAGEAFYGFFHRIDLRPLDGDEVRSLWHHLTGIDLTCERVIPIRTLSGGNPRLITVLARFSRHSDLRDLRQDLELLIDEYTPYFKAITEVLPPVERKVLVALADIWAPATAAELAVRTRMTSSQVSALLARLVRRGAVQAVEQVQGKQGYELTERLYNLYHLLRSRDDDVRVLALVDILVHLLDPVELERLVLPGLVQPLAGHRTSPLDTRIASRLERHIDEAGVWERMGTKDLKERLPVLQALLALQLAELGDEHEDTSFTRRQVAFILSRIGYSGNPAEKHHDGGRRHLQQMKEPAHNEYGAGDRLAQRNKPARPADAVAFPTGKIGDAQAALGLYRQLAVACERVLGPVDRLTLAIRQDVAHFAWQSGDRHHALQLYHHLAADQERVLGPDHPDTLTSRRMLAFCTGETTGNPGQALEKVTDVLSRAASSPDPASPRLRAIRRVQGALEVQILESGRPLPREFRELAETLRSLEAAWGIAEPPLTRPHVDPMLASERPSGSDADRGPEAHEWRD